MPARGFRWSRAGDDGQIVAADRCVRARETDDGVFFLHVAAGQFVSLGDADDFGDAGKLFQVAAIHFALVAGDADGGALRPGKRMGAKAQLLDVFADRLNLLRRSLRLHDDQHDWSLNPSV